MPVDTIHSQDRRSYDLEWFLNKKTILRQRMFPDLIGRNCIRNLSKQLEFIDEYGRNTIETMYNSYNIKYCNSVHAIDNNSTNCKTSDIVRYIDIIHSGFSAGKLENHNGFTNLVNNISMFSISGGGML